MRRMKMVTLTIDGLALEAEEGERILHVALRNSIFIPHLCYLEGDEEPFGGCRLCLVEIEGKGKPVTACTERVQDGMVVRTQTERVTALRRSALSLLLSNHRVDCGHCFANGRCGLQDLARRFKMGLKAKGLKDLSMEESLDRTLSPLVYDRSKCVLCGRCVRWSKSNGTGIFQFARRGLATTIALFPWDGDRKFIEEAWKICPVGALYPQQEQI
jgi:NADH dehydrogenase/NADH:ubiquinone oxidoreductase subunit G